MTELPQPDLMDRSGRARRVVLALIVAAAAAALVYAIAMALMPESELTKPHVSINRNLDARGFIIYITLGAFLVGFVVALAIANRIAKKRAEHDRVARAKLVS